jgi:hypothetical protein
MYLVSIIHLYTCLFNGPVADCQLPSSAEVMKEYSSTSTPPLGPCGLLHCETLPYLTLPYLNLPYLTLPYLTSGRLQIRHKCKEMMMNTSMMMMIMMMMMMMMIIIIITLQYKFSAR